MGDEQGELWRRAVATPDAPWLFYRHGWDWSWRSWAQVADQVARVAEVLRREADPLGPNIGHDPRLDPDPLAIALAIQRVGRRAVPEPRPADAPALSVWPAGAAAEHDHQDLWVPVPTCHSRRRSIRPPAPEPAVSVVEDAAAWKAAARFDDELSRRGLLATPGIRRPILCADPELPRPLLAMLRAWSLRCGAVWALERDPEAFVPAVRWVRPTLVVARRAALEQLAETAARRRNRRWSRLAAVVEIGEPAGDEPMDWPVPGVAQWRLGEDGSASPRAAGP